jgi:hypothetical protein
MVDFDVRHLVLLAYTLLVQAQERVVTSHDVDLIEAMAPVIGRALAALASKESTAH